MSATILRQWLVLSMLPKAPRRIDAASIELRLRERGIEVHRRTIQRDLLELARVFPIVSDEKAKPYGWRWSDDAKSVQVASPKDEAIGKWIDVSLRVRKGSLDLLLDRLGARNKRVCNDSGGRSDAVFATVVVTVEDCRFTRRLLLGHGDEVEVLAPAQLQGDRRPSTSRSRKACSVSDSMVGGWFDAH